MKKLLLVLVVAFTLTDAYAQSITVGEDGIVRCKDVPIGTISKVGDISYEVVDRSLLIIRRNEGKDLSTVCVSNITNMRSIFENTDFNEPIGNWDVSNVTSMFRMFKNSSFNQPIGNWDVSLVEDFTELFRGTPFNHPLGQWDVSAAKNMKEMFRETTFNQPIENWNVSSVISMTGMFNESNFNQPLNNWDVSSVLFMPNMFTSSDFDQPLDNWDVSSVENMHSMFYDSDFNQPIANWNVSNVTTMMSMFSRSSFNQRIGNWDVSNVTTMSAMFATSPFNQPLGDWDVSAVTDMSSMFINSQFNQEIGLWDVSNVTKMGSMFASSPFDKSIRFWCVSKISEEPIGFSTNSGLSVDKKPIWGTCIRPAIVTHFFPAPNAENIPVEVPFSWAKDTLSSAYQLELQNDAEIVLIDTLVSDTTFTSTLNLDLNTAYYWRVRGYSDTLRRYGDWNPLSKFTTILDTSIDQIELPIEFVLHQNYPNPFNPSTVIQFDLPESQQVTLQIFDGSGRIVSELLNQAHYSAGKHQISFNGTPLASGIYVYTLRTSNGMTISRKMALIK